jgi:hypothetical protein
VAKATIFLSQNAVFLAIVAQQHTGFFACRAREKRFQLAETVFLSYWRENKSARLDTVGEFVLGKQGYFRRYLTCFCS